MYFQVNPLAAKELSVFKRLLWQKLDILNRRFWGSMAPKIVYISFETKLGKVWFSLVIPLVYG